MSISLFHRGAVRLRLIASVLLLFVFGIAGSGFAADAETPFSLYYQGRESLILHRLQLDPSTLVVDTLSGAQAAVYQDRLPPPGPELDALKARISEGMGLVLILGGDVDAASLKTLTDGAIEQTGVVDAPPGPEHA